MVVKENDPARHFARLKREVPDGDTGVSLVPYFGMCLSTFMVAHDAENPDRILLGKIKPVPEWERIGGLNAERAKGNVGLWILPACQLLLYESPKDALVRIAREMLGLNSITSGEPIVESDTSDRKDANNVGFHWDIHFIYKIPLLPSKLPRHSNLWEELSFIDVKKTPRSAFGRGHGDILEYAGIPTA